MGDRPCSSPFRLAVVLSHPIQYYSPWFKYLAEHSPIALKVFYLWDFGVEARFDPDFARAIQWDVPLLEGYEHEFIPNKSRRPGTGHFRGLVNPHLVGALESWRPDAILLFGYAYLSHLRVLLSPKLWNVPLFLRGDSHDLARAPGLRPKLARWARSLLFKRFTGFLAVGKANTDYYRHCGIPQDRIHFVPHCVDNARFQAAAPQAEAEAREWRAKLGIPADSRVILFAGKFESKKRPMDLLEAFLRIEADQDPKDPTRASLLFVGSGAWEERLRARAGERVGYMVFFAPFQNQSQMPKVYASGDLLVLPSESETWGLAVNEAMNLARPVIVSTHVGCGADLVRSGETGWSFAAGDVAALAAVLSEALGLPATGLSKIGRAGRERVGCYSFESAMKALLAALPVKGRPAFPANRLP